MLKTFSLKSIRITACVLLALMLLSLTPAFLSSAAETGKNVRVGWYESPFNTTGKNGKRSGYAYEYQLKIAYYTGWEYTYVNGSWPELMQLLENGEIDLLSDVSYTEERSSKMLFGNLPMGSEEYILYVSQFNTSISSDNLATLNGKRIGVNKGSVQAGFFREWAERRSIEAELVELTSSESDSVAMLNSGDLDAYITLNAYGDVFNLVPICKIGSSDFYFAVRKDRPDLLEDLNRAQNRIQDENPYYNQTMSEKYIKRFGALAVLSQDEISWLEKRGTVRVGYQDNYLAFCASDPETGELTGALKDYLDCASDCFGNGHIDFLPVAYRTAEDALKALDRGEVDCVFPINLSGYDGEQMNILISPSIMKTEVFAIVRKSDSSFFGKKEHVTVAVNEGNPNYNVFLENNYPGWRTVYFPTTADCLDALGKRLADCVLISNFRYNNISRLCEKYDLVSYTTGLNVDYCFAVKEGSTELYSIMAKTAGLVPSSTVNAALSEYSSQDVKQTFLGFVRDNLALVLIFAAAVIFIVVLLLLLTVRSSKRSKKLISATEKDRLTGLLNRNYFFEYVNGLLERNPDEKYDAVALNIDQFHIVNEMKGREYGDRILKILGNEIKAIASDYKGIAGRTGGDRFNICIKHTDGYQALYDRLRDKLDSLPPSSGVRVRMGVMPWRDNVEPEILFDNAVAACNLSRGNNEGGPVVFDDGLMDRKLRDIRLLDSLRKALDCFEIEVYYQPKFDISSDRPVLAGAEALVRWNHPDFGVLSPDDFIPMLEENGKIFDLDRYVWSCAARQIASWKNQFGVTVPISVNLSRLDVFQPELGNIIGDILARNDLERKDMPLEVTETAYTANSDHVASVIESLRDRGFVVEMDDFGTGYSSLSMISRMPLDVIKMDRSFVTNITNSSQDAQLVELILGISKNLGVPVVAEGVENDLQLEMLRKMGCSQVQGFYFSPAVHPTDFEKKYLSGN